MPATKNVLFAKFEVLQMTKSSRTLEKNLARCPFEHDKTLSLIYCRKDPQTLCPANSSCMLKTSRAEKSFNIHAHRCNSAFLACSGKLQNTKKTRHLTFEAASSPSSNGVNLIFIVRSARSSHQNFLRRFPHSQLNHVAQTHKIIHW